MNHHSGACTAILTGTFFLCSLCVGFFSAHAETLPVSASSTDTVEDATVRDNGDTRQERRTERYEALSRAIQDRIINLTHNATSRLTAAINRLQNITDRLDSRIEKLNGLGVDTSASVAKLGEAKAALGRARTTLSSIGSIDTAIRGDAPHESFREIRTKFFETRDALIQTRTILLETVALLKESVRASSGTQGVADAVRSEESTSTPNPQ